MKSIALNGSNSQMPSVGFGTWQIRPEDIESAINSALDAGYRHFDTAFNYNNEEAIGKILCKSLLARNIDRSEVFITTKLPNIANQSCCVEKFLKLSLANLQLTYIDLYLIHVPFGFVCDEGKMSPKVLENGELELDTTTDHISLWKAMEEVQEKGLTKNIGLSNFNELQIDSIYESARIKPSVLQVECHAYLQQPSLVAYCSKKNIVLTAYSPLGSPGSQKHFSTKYNYILENFPDILGNPTVREMATKYNKTSAQILLRFLNQSRIVVIPKSCNPQRMKENIEIFDFEINPNDLISLKKLDAGEEGRIINFFVWKGVEKHPHYPFPLKA